MINKFSTSVVLTQHVGFFEIVCFSFTKMKTQDRAEETSSRGASAGSIGTDCGMSRGVFLFVTVNFNSSVVCPYCSHAQTKKRKKKLKLLLPWKDRGANEKEEWF